MKKRALLVGLAFLLVSCSTTAPLQVLFIRNGVLQYYLPEAETTIPGFSLSLDLNFRDDPELESPVTVNYSLRSLPGRPKIPTDQFFLTEKGTRIALESNGILYQLPGKGLTRMTTAMSREKLETLLDERAARFVVELPEAKSVSFPIPNGMKQNLESLRENVLR
jgi:hypothetical protein